MLTPQSSRSKLATTKPRLLRSWGFAAGFVLLSAVFAGPAHSKAHLWRISEIFSNADGTIQFIEFRECCGSPFEDLMTFTSISSSSQTYLFPNDLPGNFPPYTGSANGWLLLATAGFAALPGAPPEVDFIIPDNFFDPTGDTIDYMGAPDSVVLAPGALPLDGVTSIHRDITTGTLSTGVNSPTGYLRVPGSVSLASPVPTAPPWLVAPLVLMTGTALAAIRKRRRTV